MRRSLAVEMVMVGSWVEIGKKGFERKIDKRD
jgi:hypothetical protein